MTPPDTSRGRLFSQAPIAVVGITLLVLIAVAAVMVAPVTTSDEAFPVPTIRFWWARIAPRSYAIHRLETVGYFAPVDTPLLCTHLEDPDQAWETLLLDERSEELFLQVLASGSAGGRLYALTGLAALESSRLHAAIDLAHRDTARVRFTPDLARPALPVLLASLVHGDSLVGWAARLRRAAGRKCAG